MGDNKSGMWVVKACILRYHATGEIFRFRLQLGLWLWGL